MNVSTEDTLEAKRLIFHKHCFSTLVEEHNYNVPQKRLFFSQRIQKEIKPFKIAASAFVGRVLIFVEEQHTQQLETDCICCWVFSPSASIIILPTNAG